MRFETECDGGFTISRGEDATGYPCFFVHGLSGDQKRDAESLNNMGRMFAAAPLLLESLQWWVERLEHPKPMSHEEAVAAANDGIEKARAAIAKATT